MEKPEFLKTLQRNNSQIRGERAELIYEDVRMLYKRKLEDIQYSIRKLEAERMMLTDISPKNATDLTFKFDSEAFVERDIQIGTEIKNLQDYEERISKRFSQLFETQEA